MFLGLRCVLPTLKEKHQRVQPNPEGWARSQVSAWPPWLVWRPAARGASLAEILLLPGLAVLLAGSGHPVALIGVAVTAGWRSECLT